MDNRLFNVNGESPEMLEKALELALIQSNNKGFASWIVDPKKGLVLCWTDVNGGNAFMGGKQSAKAIVDQVVSWLRSEQAEAIPTDEMCETLDDMDVSNELGWQVYCEKWGHVGDNHYAICAVRPAYLWFGK